MSLLNYIEDNHPGGILGGALTGGIISVVSFEQIFSVIVLTFIGGIIGKFAGDFYESIKKYFKNEKKK